MSLIVVGDLLVGTGREIYFILFLENSIFIGIALERISSSAAGTLIIIQLAPAFAASSNTES